MKNFKKLTLFVAMATVAVSSINAESKSWMPTVAGIREVFANAGSAVANGAQSAANATGTFVSKTGSAVANGAQSAANATGTFVSKTGSVIANGAQSAANATISATKQAGTLASTGAHNAASFVAKSAANLDKALGHRPSAAVAQATAAVVAKKEVVGFVAAALTLSYILNRCANAEASEITSESLEVAPENTDQKTVTILGYYRLKAAAPAGKNIVGGYCTTCERSETMCGCPCAGE